MTDAATAQEEKWAPVYQETERNDYYDSPEWRRLRKQCLRRDGYKCQRCGTHYPYGKELTAHHIVPREEGGGNYLENLIALCEDCHDLVEGQGLKTRASIIGCPDFPSDPADGDPVVESEPDERPKRPLPYNPNATPYSVLVKQTRPSAVRAQRKPKREAKWKRCRYFIRPSDSRVVASCRRVTGRGYRSHLTVDSHETRYWRWDGTAKDWWYEKFSDKIMWAEETCADCGLFYPVEGD